MRPKDGNIGRYITLPVALDAWLRATAEERGYSSLQEFLREIVRDARDASIGLNRAEQPRTSEEQESVAA